MRLYQFKLICFGLTNTPGVFQAVINNVFRHLINKSVLIYMDGILVFSKTKQEHLQHLEQVLKILQTNHLTAKMSKCHFFREKLQSLGYTISKEGIQPDQDKVRAVQT